MAWRRPGDKPLSEPMLVSLLTHICVTRPQWVNVFQNMETENGNRFLQTTVLKAILLKTLLAHFLLCYSFPLSPISYLLSWVKCLGKSLGLVFAPNWLVKFSVPHFVSDFTGYPIHLAYFGTHPIVLLVVGCWRRHASASTLLWHHMMQHHGDPWTVEVWLAMLSKPEISST